MKTFTCYIKSGTDYPDFEDTFECETRREAIDHFTSHPTLIELKPEVIEKSIDMGEEIDESDISPEDRPEPHLEPNPMTREEER